MTPSTVAEQTVTGKAELQAAELALDTAPWCGDQHVRHQNGPRERPRAVPRGWCGYAAVSTDEASADATVWQGRAWGWGRCSLPSPLTPCAVSIYSFISGSNALYLTESCVHGGTGQEVLRTPVHPRRPSRLPPHGHPQSDTLVTSQAPMQHRHPTSPVHAGFRALSVAHPAMRVLTDVSAPESSPSPSPVSTCGPFRTWNVERGSWPRPVHSRGGVPSRCVWALPASPCPFVL